jgi:hypothetical protein
MTHQLTWPGARPFGGHSPALTSSSWPMPPRDGDRSLRQGPERRRSRTPLQRLRGRHAEREALGCCTARPSIPSLAASLLLCRNSHRRRRHRSPRLTPPYNVEISSAGRSPSRSPRHRPSGARCSSSTPRSIPLLREPAYTDAIKGQIVTLVKTVGPEKQDDGGDYAVLRQNRGRLLKRPKTGGLEIVATRHDDWIGWVELKAEPVDELATQHTAMVMCDVAADILVVVEAEDRIALRDFSDVMLAKVGAPRSSTSCSSTETTTAASTSASSPARAMASPQSAPTSTTPTRTDGSSAATVPSTRSRPLPANGSWCSSTTSRARASGATPTTTSAASDRPAGHRRLRKGGREERGRPRRLQRHPGVDTARAAAREDRPTRHRRPPQVQKRRKVGHVRQRHQGQQDRLHPVLAHAVQASHRRGDLAQGRLGGQEEHALAALPHHDEGRRGGKTAEEL